MSRENARKDAAFSKGAIGVDGGNTDVEERDEAELEKDKAREQMLRGRTWLGREFLTWLTSPKVQAELPRFGLEAVR